MEERQEGGISLSEILSLIWKRIIWILAISIAAVIVVALVGMFVISPSKEKYQLSFVIEYPNQFGEESTEKLQYPDGTAFRFETAVFADNLEKAKNSDEAFKNIDTKKMSSSGDIGVSASQLSGVAGGYTLTVSSKYFKNSEQATKFLKAICNETKEIIVEKAEAINYSTGLSGYDSVATVGQQIKILENQHESVLAQYEKYLGLYAKFSYNEKTLESYYSEATVFFNRKDLVNAQIIMKENEKELHTKAYDVLEAEMEKLVKDNLISYEGLNGFTTQMAEHQEEIAKLDLEIQRLVEEGEGEKPVEEKDVKTELQKLYDAILTETETCDAVVSALYDTNTVFRYEHGEVVKTDEVSAVKYVLITFVAAFVVVSAVFCIVDYTRKKKAAKSADAAETKTAETENESEKEKE